MDDFQTVNKIYQEYFTEKFPARAAYQVYGSFYLLLDTARESG